MKKQVSCYLYDLINFFFCCMKMDVFKSIPTSVHVWKAFIFGFCHLKLHTKWFLCIEWTVRHLYKGNNILACCVLQGTSKTIALNLVGSQKREFEAENFTNMPNLHYLGLPDECMVNGELKCISRELRWLRWRGMPYKDVPMDLDLSQLTSLDFSESSNLASLWVDSSTSLEVHFNHIWYWKC